LAPWHKTAEGRVVAQTGDSANEYTDAVAGLTRKNYATIARRLGRLGQNTGGPATAFLSIADGKFEVGYYDQDPVAVDARGLVVALALDELSGEVRLVLDWPADPAEVAALREELQQLANELNQPIHVPGPNGVDDTARWHFDIASDGADWETFLPRRAEGDTPAESAYVNEADHRLTPKGGVLVTHYPGVVVARPTEGDEEFYSSVPVRDDLLTLDLDLLDDGRIGVYRRGKLVPVGPLEFERLYWKWGGRGRDIRLINKIKPEQLATFRAHAAELSGHLEVHFYHRLAGVELTLLDGDLTTTDQATNTVVVSGWAHVPFARADKPNRAVSSYLRYESRDGKLSRVRKPAPTTFPGGLAVVSTETHIKFAEFFYRRPAPTGLFDLLLTPVGVALGLGNADGSAVGFGAEQLATHIDRFTTIAPDLDVRLLLNDGAKHLNAVRELANKYGTTYWITPLGADVRIDPVTLKARAVDRATGKSVDWLPVQPDSYGSQMPTWFQTVDGELVPATGPVLLPIAGGLVSVDRANFHRHASQARFAQKAPPDLFPVQTASTEKGFLLPHFEGGAKLYSAVALLALMRQHGWAGQQISHSDPEPGANQAPTELLTKLRDAADVTTYRPEDNARTHIYPGYQVTIEGPDGASADWEPLLPADGHKGGQPYVTARTGALTVPTEPGLVRIGEPVVTNDGKTHWAGIASPTPEMLASSGLPTTPQSRPMATPGSTPTSRSRPKAGWR
jgi:hypothetical protein